MKVLVTGAEGMVGVDLCRELVHRGHAVIATDARPVSTSTIALDVADLGGVERLIAETRPEVVMHLGAETDVDRCEQEPAHAYRINAAGTEHVVRAARAVGAKLLYVSTAAVFDGEKPTPYVETDAPNPVNVYGRTKLAGEYAVRRHGAHQIVRASWMVGGYERDKKFVGKILRLIEERRELSVVTDKVGSLTFTPDLARGLATLVETPHTGLFHMANRGMCSRYDIAAKMLEYLGRRDVTLKPIGSDAFPLPAPRAASEAVINARLESLGLNLMPSWEDSLRVYVQQHLASKPSCASSS